jgi:AGCS family alanine or glycine:cation symporter
VFPTIDQAKPGLKKLIAALGETYPYASVLAEADDRRDWRINRAGIGISASGTGGAAGVGVKMCITWGVKRGVFSNEAGLGSAPIAHAATSETNPVKQGLYGIFEVFMDTIVICTLSGLTLLLALDGSTLNYGVEGTTSLNALALGTVFGNKAGALIIAIGLSLFALSTVLSWGLYGTRCWEYLLGEKAVKPYQIIFTLVVIISATMDLSLAWAIADTLNGLMAIPNLIGLLLLCPVVFKMTREYFDSERRLRK